MYIILYLVGLRIIFVAKKDKNGMFLNADHYTAMKQSCQIFAGKIVHTSQ